MGERFDVLVTLADGAFSFVACAEGKDGYVLAVVVTTPRARPPNAATTPPELARHVLLGTDLRTSRPACPTDTSRTPRLGGSMSPGTGAPSPAPACPTPTARRPPGATRPGSDQVRDRGVPPHAHPRTYLQPGGRRSTRRYLIVRPMQKLDIDTQADNPGHWPPSAQPLSGRRQHSSSPAPAARRPTACGCR